MSDRENPEVATHVLVPVSTAEKLRELSKKTRITQSEFLREGFCLQGIGALQQLFAKTCRA